MLSSPEWLPMLATGAVIGGWAITIAFMVYALRSSAVPSTKRRLWAAVIFLGNMLAIPFFWFWYVWKRDESASPGT
jgi:hypothetical protein